MEYPEIQTKVGGQGWLIFHTLIPLALICLLGCEKSQDREDIKTLRAEVKRLSAKVEQQTNTNTLALSGSITQTVTLQNTSAASNYLDQEVKYTNSWGTVISTSLELLKGGAEAKRLPTNLTGMIERYDIIKAYYPYITNISERLEFLKSNQQIVKTTSLLLSDIANTNDGVNPREKWESINLVIFKASQGEVLDMESGKFHRRELKDEQPILELPKINAEILYSHYDANEVNADQEYKGKTMLIKGDIFDIGKDFAGRPYIIIGHKRFGAAIQCFFTDNSVVANTYKGQSVIVKGIIDGKSLLYVSAKNCALSD